MEFWSNRFGDYNATKTKNTITEEILLNSKNLNKIKPTYAVRGIFPFPKAVMDFQFTWKITQHQRGTFKNIAGTLNPLQNSNLTTFLFYSLFIVLQLF